MNESLVYPARRPVAESPRVRCATDGGGMEPPFSLFSIDVRWKERESVVGLVRRMCRRAWRTCCRERAQRDRAQILPLLGASAVPVWCTSLYCGVAAASRAVCSSCAETHRDDESGFGSLTRAWYGGRLSLSGQRSEGHPQ